MSPEPPVGATSLARALARRAAEPDAVAPRMAVYEALAAADLYVLLEAEAEGATIRPRLFPLETGPTVLAFDTEGALADFAGVAVAYAALPGRVLAGLAAGQGLAVLIQTGAGDAELLQPDALDWFGRTLAAPVPRAARGVPAGFHPPDLPPGTAAVLLPALERRLRGVPGLSAAVLAGVTWRDGGRGHLLALVGVPEAAQAPLARAVAEALVFSGAAAGIEAGALDVIFPEPGAMAAIAARGLALSLPPQDTGPDAGAEPVGPGMDPNRPPRLR